MAKDIRQFSDIARAFVLNVNALRALNDHIGGLADEHDRNRVDSFMARIEEVFEFDTSAEVSSLASDPVAEPSSQQQPTPSVGDAVGRVFADPSRSASLFKIAKDFARVPPLQSALLRRGALTTLVSFFEALLAELMHSYYSRNPAALPQDAHALTLGEIKELGSIADAERRILERESEAVLRQSLDDQLKYFSHRLKIDLAPIEAYRPALGEVVQRRNLIVHNNGVVNRVYLSKVAPEFIESHNLTEGMLLRTGAKYLSEAISWVYSVGIILLQQCWRKWDKVTSDSADRVLSDQSYESLLAKRYDETIRIEAYARTVDNIAERSQRVIIVNAAIAFQRLDKSDEATALVESVDWSAASLDFRLAIDALKRDVTAVCALLPKAVASESITEENVREWPLFDELRGDSRFIEVLQQVFGGNSGAPLVTDADERPGSAPVPEAEES